MFVNLVEKTKGPQTLIAYGLLIQHNGIEVEETKKPQTVAVCGSVIYFIKSTQFSGVNRRTTIRQGGISTGSGGKYNHICQLVDKHLVSLFKN